MSQTNLVIVESPTKSRTISKFLGNEYLVCSSFGHVRDLPKSTLGIDTKNGFKPKYVIPAKAKKVIAELKEAAKKSDTVILATDEDREGEAIAWHLAETLELRQDTSCQSSTNNHRTKESGLKAENRKPKAAVARIVFHEITKPAITRALENPRDIDMNLVDAQQARRVLDRLVGYELSPFLWKKIRSGLSAGRVQSVAVRLVVEREREIQNFVKQEYWSIEAHLEKAEESESAEKKTFRAKLIKIGDKTLEKLGIKNQDEADKITKDLQDARYQVANVEKKEIRRTPPPPFTTSTLQQEASRKLGLSAKQTMMAAQRLYETGHITYMRTDSVNLAQSALSQAQKVISEKYGQEYTLDKPRQYTTKTKGAQEAHEAIRPTNFSHDIENLGKGLEQNQARLYDLIWKRAIACQMQPAVFDQTAIDIPAINDQQPTAGFIFRANGQVTKFDGFIRAYTEGRDEENEEDQEGKLPELLIGEKLNLIELLPEQHFTEPPSRFTDATLVKTLEAHGIGRPSTYAPILSTIQDRGYVEKIEKRYQPTEIGFLVNDMLVKNFPEIVDVNFTAKIEEELDDIAEGKIKWIPVVEGFYWPFKQCLTEKETTVEKIEEESDISCQHCGKKMLIKFGRNGKFLACPDPKSRITQPMPEEAAKLRDLKEKTEGEKCPLCGKPMEVKRGRFGYFLGCSSYPQCKGIAKIENKIGFKCPACPNGELVERRSRKRGKIFYGCNQFPRCKFLVNKKPESEKELEELYKNWKKNPPKLKKSKK